MRTIITVLRSEPDGSSAVGDLILLGVAGIVIVFSWPYIGGPVTDLFRAFGHLLGLS